MVRNPVFKTVPIGAFVSILMLASCRPAVPPPEMVAIPAGEFIMGSDRIDTEGLARELGMIRSLYVDEHPKRRLNLPVFWIDRFELTNRRYAEFVAATGASPPSNWPNGRVEPNREDHPVSYVSWEEARAYCIWAGKRLPSEAEWEKATRGPEGLEYPWGDVFDSERANTGDSEPNDTRPVGSYESGRSPFGVYDMVGNAAEWVDDVFAPYPGNPVTEGPLYGKNLRVIRGGSWGGGGGHFAMSIFYRAAHRLFGEPAARYPDTGFRCAKTPSR